MLDTRSDDRLSSIRFLDMAGHGFKVRLFPVNLRDKAMLLHEVLVGFRAIGCVALRHYPINAKH